LHFVQNCEKKGVYTIKYVNVNHPQLRPSISLYPDGLNSIANINKKVCEQSSGLFLEATGQSLPHRSQTVSASAISRFLNHYQWSVRAVIRVVRVEMIGQVKAERGAGRRPILTVILDMTTRRKNW
jgi:hypothetical protein